MCSGINQVNLMCKVLLLYIVIVYLNVLGPPVKHWVVCQLYVAHVVAIQGNWLHYFASQTL